MWARSLIRQVVRSFFTFTSHFRFDASGPIIRALPALIVLLAWTVTAHAQGSPDLVWSKDYTTGGATSVGYSPTAQTIVTGETDRASQLWLAADGTASARLAQTQIGCGTVNDVAFSPDGQIVATINGCTVKLWSVSTATLIRTINSGGGANASNSHTSVAFSPDGLIVASSVSTAYGAGSVSLWRVADGTLIRTMSGGGGTDLRFSPDGKSVASIGLSKSAGVAIWRVADGALLVTIPGVIQALAFSRDGSLIATGGLAGGEYVGDDTIEFYQVSDGALVRRFTRTGGVGSLAFTPDGAGLISAGYDPNQDANSGFTSETGVIRIWRLSDGALLKTYDQATGTNVPDVAISPDGKYFAFAFGKTTALARMPDISNSAPAFSIDPKTVNVGCAGGEGKIGVFAPAGKNWIAQSRVSWITLSGAVSGSGNGTVNYTVTSNGCRAVAGSDLTMEGQVVVAQQPFIVKQKLAVSADPAPTPEATPTPTPTPTPESTPTPTAEATPTASPSPSPDPSPDTPPVLLTEEGSDKAIALDSVSWIRDPLSVTTASNYFAADGHTRVMLFAMRLPSGDGSAITAEVEDAEHRTYPLVLEYVGHVSQLDWLSEVIVRLPDEISNANQVWISIKVHGAASNKVAMRIRP